MSTYSEEIFEALNSIVRRLNLSDVEESVAALASPRSDKVLIGAGSGVNSDMFRAWVESTKPEVLVEQESLSLLPTNAVRHLTFDRVVVTVPGDHLISSQDVDAFTKVVFSRPHESYAFVVIGAEAIQSDDDKERLERSLWRLVVPSPKASWNGQALSSHQCFFWAPNRDGLFGDQCQRDEEKLRTWLRSSNPGMPDLTNQRIDLALDLVEQALPSEDFATAAEREQRIRRLMLARNDNVDLKTRLLRVLDHEESVIRDQLANSLRVLERDLTQSLPEFLQRNDLDGVRPSAIVFSDPAVNGNGTRTLGTIFSMKLRRSPWLRNSEQRQHILSKYIEDGTRKWEPRAQSQLLANDDRIRADLNESTKGVDWDLVNSVSEVKDAPKDPEYLLSFAELNVQTHFSLSGDQAFASAMTRSNGRQPVLGGSIVAAVAATVFRLNPILATVAGVAGFVGASSIRARTEREAMLAEFEIQGIAAIRQVIRSAVDQVQLEATRQFDDWRNHIRAEIEKIDQRIEHAIELERSVWHAAEPDRQRLSELRHKRSLM